MADTDDQVAIALLNKSVNDLSKNVETLVLEVREHTRCTEARLHAVEKDQVLHGERIIALQNSSQVYSTAIDNLESSEKRWGVVGTLIATVISSLISFFRPGTP